MKTRTFGGTMAGKNVSNSTVTKADIVDRVYEKIGFSKKEASDLVEIVFDALRGTLVKGEKVKISGFGKFEVKQKKERVGRNPQTGDRITISARRVLNFSPSQVLKAMLNGKSDFTGGDEFDDE